MKMRGREGGGQGSPQERACSYFDSNVPTRRGEAGSARRAKIRARERAEDAVRTRGVRLGANEIRACARFARPATRGLVERDKKVLLAGVAVVGANRVR